MIHGWLVVALAAGLMIAGSVIELLAVRRTQDPLALAWAGLADSALTWLGWLLVMLWLSLPAGSPLGGWAMWLLAGFTLLLGGASLARHWRRVRAAGSGRLESEDSDG